MTIKDVIKDKVYAGLIGGAGWSFTEMLLIFGGACLISLYIFYVYKLTSKAGFYSRDLNVTIAGMVIVVATIMIAMQSSLIVSLGMVGALSVIRFRNAVKNPLDLLYLFWAVSAGIICGVGLYLLAILFCLVMTIMIMVLENIPHSQANALLVLSSSSVDIDLEIVYEIVKKHSKYYKEKSCTIIGNEIEVIIEIKAIKKAELLKELQQKVNLNRINYLSHDGEFRV